MWSRSTKTSSLIFNNFYVSTLILGIWNKNLHDSQLLTEWDNSQSNATAINGFEVGSDHISLVHRSLDMFKNTLIKHFDMFNLQPSTRNPKPMTPNLILKSKLQSTMTYSTRIRTLGNWHASLETYPMSLTICKSTTLIDLLCPFIDVGQLHVMRTMVRRITY